MRPLVLISTGVAFVLMGIGLFALSLRKPKPLPAMPTKTQLREQAELAQETKKMRIAAGIAVGAGAIATVLGFL